MHFKGQQVKLIGGKGQVTYSRVEGELAVDQCSTVEKGVAIICDTPIDKLK